MFLMTPADSNPELAAALGRFSQACNYLEKQIAFILTRLLPLTTEMGRVLFSNNQAKRNIEILTALMFLPEVPISEEARNKLRAAIPRLKAINEDRSRFFHNKIIDQLGPPYMLVMDKQDGKNSVALEISVSLIDQRTAEAKALFAEIFIQPVHYDLTTWGQAFPTYPTKPYPTQQPPNPQRSKAQKQSDRKRSEEKQTTPKSAE